MKQFGIDVSMWQGSFDFSAAKKEGVTFAVIKAGGGDDGLYIDPRFEENYAEAKAQGLAVGAYWFSKAVSVKEAQAEADFFYKNALRGKQLELPVFVDVEHKSMIYLGKDLLTEVVDAWCQRMESYGFWVGIYASVYAFSAYMHDDRLKRYSHWVAQWAEECSYPNKDILGLWQFGGETNLIRRNTVAGVVCDQNYMYFDFPKNVKAAGLNGFGEPPKDMPDIENVPDINEPIVSVPPLTKPKETEQLAYEVISGAWGNGDERKKRLTVAGYDYDEVQKRVDEIVAERLAEDANRIRVGDLVRVSKDATVYGTNKPFASFVYSSLLYVREVNKNRIVISTEPNGAVTGAVHKKFLTKPRT